MQGSTYLVLPLFDAGKTSIDLKVGYVVIDVADGQLVLQ